MRPLPRLRSVAEKAREGTLKLHFYLESIQLLQKPITMMTGEEQTFLIGSSKKAKRSETTPIVQKRTYYGIEGIAQVFGCSVPTANRIKRSGIIDAAITQIGRKIIVDADMALSLAKEAGSIKLRHF